MILENCKSLRQDRNKIPIAQELRKDHVSFLRSDVTATAVRDRLVHHAICRILTPYFDRQFIKRKLKAHHYIRYADDFVILHEDKTYLIDLTPKISDFLRDNLHLELHPKKLFLKTLASGVDFLGWVHSPHHRVPRTSTKRRMLKKLEQSPSAQSVASYIGILKHGNAHKLTQRVKASKSQSNKKEQSF